MPAGSQTSARAKGLSGLGKSFAALSLPSRLEDAASQLAAFTEAAKATRASLVLPQLLALVLAAGNVLNAGTPKGSARGFRLEVLLKLSETKSSGEPQVSLGHDHPAGSPSLISRWISP